MFQPYILYVWGEEEEMFLYGYTTHTQRERERHEP
jgi:hypothetical protein